MSCLSLLPILTYVGKEEVIKILPKPYTTSQIVFPQRSIL